MTQIVEIRRCDDPRDAIHRACHRLAEGDLVAFPTENGLSDRRQPLERQGHGKTGQNAVGRSAFVAAQILFELWDYVPRMPSHGDKLSRRGWPGPLTIALPNSAVGGIFRDFSAETKAALCANDGTVSFRVSAQSVLNDVLQFCPAPLVACSERQGDRLMPRNAAEVALQFGDQVAMIFDDGPCRYGEPSTVAGVDSKEWKILEPGVLSECTLQRLCSEVFLFVCTGNTCRSPMAEALFRRLLSERLHCSDEELMDRGFNVLSAGLSAANGSPASREAVNILAEEGLTFVITKANR